MSSKALATAIAGLIALVLATIVAVVAPDSPGGAFWIGVVALALSLVALTTSARAAVGSARAGAAIWLRLSAVPVALTWSLFATLQAATSSVWSWKVALVLEVIAGAVCALVALVARSAGATADREASSDRDRAERRLRVTDAAQRALAESGRSPQRLRIAALARRALTLPEAAYDEPFAAEELGANLDHLARLLPNGREADVEALVTEMEGVAPMRGE